MVYVYVNFFCKYVKHALCILVSMMGSYSANEVFASDCHSVSRVTQNVVNELLRNYLQAISLGTRSV